MGRSYSARKIQAVARGKKGMKRKDSAKKVLQGSSGYGLKKTLFFISWSARFARANSYAREALEKEVNENATSQVAPRIG